MAVDGAAAILFERESGARIAPDPSAIEAAA